MNYTEWCAARQLLAEERVGRRLRAEQGAEDEAFGASRDAISRMK